MTDTPTDRMAGREWRRVSKYEWWLVFTDAPEDLGRDGPVGYPPSMSINWVGADEDGSGAYACCHVYSYFNGAWPDDADEANVEYLHVCDPRDLIAELQAWMTTVKYPGKEQV